MLLSYIGLFTSLLFLYFVQPLDFLSNSPICGISKARCGHKRGATAASTASYLQRAGC